MPSRWRDVGCSLRVVGRHRLVSSSSRPCECILSRRRRIGRRAPCEIEPDRTCISARAPSGPCTIHGPCMPRAGLSFFSHSSHAKHTRPCYDADSSANRTVLLVPLPTPPPAVDAGGIELLVASGTASSSSTIETAGADTFACGESGATASAIAAAVAAARAASTRGTKLLDALMEAGETSVAAAALPARTIAQKLNSSATSSNKGLAFCSRRSGPSTWNFLPLLDTYGIKYATVRGSRQCRVRWSQRIGRLAQLLGRGAASLASKALPTQGKATWLTGPH